MVLTPLATSAVKPMRYLIRLISLVFLVTASFNLPALAKSANPQWVHHPPLGEWSAQSPWPAVGVHLAVLADGRVVTWGEDIPLPGTTAFPTYVVTIPSG